MICSDETGAKADNVALEIIKSCHRKAANILKGNMEALHKISLFLIEEETITGEQFMEILNEVKKEIQ